MTEDDGADTSPPLVDHNARENADVDVRVRQALRKDSVPTTCTRRCDALGQAKAFRAETRKDIIISPRNKNEKLRDRSTGSGNCRVEQNDMFYCVVVLFRPELHVFLGCSLG